MIHNSRNKVWIEISESSIRHNFEAIYKLLQPGTELWAVVKSNAYGHGIFDFSRVINRMNVGGFCVDSVVEAKTLRKQGISRPILVLGPTLPSLYMQAMQNKVILSLSSLDSLDALIKEVKTPSDRPEIHIKLETGMHRQGLSVADLRKALVIIKKNGVKLRGIFSHFANAKDINYPTYSNYQLARFEVMAEICEKAGFPSLKKHIAATGGTMIDPKNHLNAVRVGIGLYGLFPSKELEVQLGETLPLKPALSWRARISEIKTIPKDAFVGYDLSEQVHRKTKIAVLPIGYWHGLDRRLSQRGWVLIKGRRARILGKISMDITVVDVSSISCEVDDVATIIGEQGKEVVFARDLADKIETTPYEIITRINPLIERVVVR